MNRTPMSQSYVNSQAGQDQPANQQQQQQQTNQAASSSSNNNNNNNNNNNGQQTSSNINNNNNQGQASGASGTSGAGAAGATASGGGAILTGEQMPQLMCATELTNLLLEFAFSVFVNKPQDIVEYAASYFNQLQTRRTSPAQQQQQQPQVAANYGKRASSDSQRSNLSQNSINNDNSYNNNTQTNNSIGQSSSQNNNNDYQEDDFDCESASFSRGGVNFANSNLQQQPFQPPPQTKLSYNRRKSVFAEQYDPANDQEDDENNRVVHSKTDEQRIRLAKAIKSIFIFRSVDSQDMTQILDAMFEVKVSAGDVVIRQGDDGDNFYVVERGKFQIYVSQDDGSRQIRGEYENNGSFGELALMYNQPRAATVVALTDGSLWAMDRNTFRRIVLKSAFKKRKEYEALFEKVSVLQCLNGYERMNLCDALESKRFLNGQMIIVQGDQANGMYFIESGNVKIVKQLEDGRVVDVAILGKGDYFGELALINHKPRAASVYAMGDDVKLAFLDVKAFERLLGSCIERMEKNCAIYLKELAYSEGRQNV